MTNSNVGSNDTLNPADKMVINKPILIVEDMVSITSLLTKLLKDRWDVDVRVANSFAKANELLTKENNNYLVAICDLNLPDAPNGEIIDLVKSFKIPAIALTGTIDKVTRKNMLKKGLVDYILKASAQSYYYVVELIGRLHKNQFIKVLIAEDSLTAMGILKRMLEVQNFQVLTAPDGKQALAILKDDPDVQILLTDYNMPDMNGFQLTVKARALFDASKLIIIGLSDMGNSQLGSLFLKNGANDFLVKPYTYDDVLSHLNQNLKILELSAQLTQSNDTSQEGAVHDRSYFYDFCEKIYDPDSKNIDTYSLIILKINQLKEINTTFGYKCGDMVIDSFSRLLTRYFTNDVIGRIGGSSFSVLANHDESFDLKASLDEFITLVIGGSLEWEKQKVKYSVSVGYVSETLDSFDEMLVSVINNLDKSKAAGENVITG